MHIRIQGREFIDFKIYNIRKDICRGEKIINCAAIFSVGFGCKKSAPKRPFIIKKLLFLQNSNSACP